jgi:hypothetical protein
VDQADPQAPRPTWAKRLDARIRNAPVVVLAVLFLTLTTTGVGIAEYVRAAIHSLHKPDWRKHEYAILAGLHSDQTVARFDQVLGAPLFKRVSQDRRWLELAYQRRGYWVQAVTPQHTTTGTVAFFAVTACSSTFEPTFKLPGGTPITLNQTTLASVRVEVPPEYRYIVPADAGPDLMEFAIGPHASDFKSYAWGLNNACGTAPSAVTARPVIDLASRCRCYIASGPVTRLPKAVRRVRRVLVVNTFAEWGPVQNSPWPRSVWIGVDEGFVSNA